MLFELACPLLLLVFLEKAEFSKRMSITQSMLALGVLRIEAQTVMLHDPVKVRQNANGIGGLLASLAMHGIMGKLIGARHMEPMQEALHTYSGLVIALHLGFA